MRKNGADIKPREMIIFFSGILFDDSPYLFKYQFNDVDVLILCFFFFQIDPHI